MARGLYGCYGTVLYGASINTDIDMRWAGGGVALLGHSLFAGAAQIHLEPSGLGVAFFQNGRRRRQQKPPTIYFRRRIEAGRRLFRSPKAHDIGLEGGREEGEDKGTFMHVHACTHTCTCTCTCTRVHNVQTKNGQGAWRGLLRAG
jgi:hypothetical protein